MVNAAAGAMAEACTFDMTETESADPVPAAVSPVADANSDDNPRFFDRGDLTAMAWQVHAAAGGHRA
jgi:hypothetical protein